MLKCALGHWRFAPSPQQCAACTASTSGASAFEVSRLRWSHKQHFGWAGQALTSGNISLPRKSYTCASIFLLSSLLQLIALREGDCYLPLTGRSANRWSGEFPKAPPLCLGRGLGSCGTPRLHAPVSSPLLARANLGMRQTRLRKGLRARPTTGCPEIYMMKGMEEI